MPNLDRLANFHPQSEKTLTMPLARPVKLMKTILLATLGVLCFSTVQAGLKDQSNLETRFKNFDKNGDGKLTHDEFVTPTGK